MADAWVSEGAAVLVCIVVPANCVTPMCPLSHFQNGVKCVGALSLRGQRPFYGQVNSLSEPYGGLWSVRTAPYFFRQ